VVEFEYDTKNILTFESTQAQISSARFSCGALGMKSNEDILRTFYQVERISLRDKDLYGTFAASLSRKLAHENPQSGNPNE